MNVIVAEDDKVLSKMVCGILNEAGHVTVQAFDSMQTMMFVSRQPPDLVVLDINMPGGTGVEVLRKLKMLSKTKFVPVIVLSGSTDPDMPAQVLALGATAVLMKPVEPEALLAAVRDSAL